MFNLKKKRKENERKNSVLFSKTSFLILAKTGKLTPYKVTNDTRLGSTGQSQSAGVNFTS